MALNLEQRVMKDDWWFILTTIDLLLCSIALAKPPSSLALAYADSPDTNAPQNRHGPSPSCAQIILPQLRQFPIKSCFWALNQILYIVRWRTRDSGDSEDLASDQGWKWGHAFVRASIRIHFTPSAQGFEIKKYYSEPLIRFEHNKREKKWKIKQNMKYLV